MPEDFKNIGADSALGAMFDAVSKLEIENNIPEAEDIISTVKNMFEEYDKNNRKPSYVGTSILRDGLGNPIPTGTNIFTKDKIEEQKNEVDPESNIVSDRRIETPFISNDRCMYLEPKYNTISQIPMSIIKALIFNDLISSKEMINISSHHLFKYLVCYDLTTVYADGENTYLIYVVGSQQYIHDISTVEDIMTFTKLLSKVLTSHNENLLNLFLKNIVHKFKAILKYDY